MFTLGLLFSVDRFYLEPIIVSSKHRLLFPVKRKMDCSTNAISRLVRGLHPTESQSGKFSVKGEMLE